MKIEEIRLYLRALVQIAGRSINLSLIVFHLICFRNSVVRAFADYLSFFFPLSPGLKNGVSSRLKIIQRYIRAAARETAETFLETVPTGNPLKKFSGKNLD